MTRLLSCLVLASCATTGSSTAGSSTPAAATAADFFALSLGSAWDYEAQMLGEKHALSLSIVKVADGVSEDSTGAKLTRDAYGVRDERRYLLRNPVETGTRWNNVVSPSSVESYEIVAVDQPCDSPAGHWEGCVIVESKNRIDPTKVLVNEMTLAPGVGIVRMATTLDDGSKRVPQSTLILRKFTAPGAAVDGKKSAR